MYASESRMGPCDERDKARKKERQKEREREREKARKQRANEREVVPACESKAILQFESFIAHNRWI